MSSIAILLGCLWAVATPASTAAGREYYHQDRLGSTGALTTATGVVEATYRTDPFGAIREQTGSSANRSVFTGHATDTNTGLVYMGARYYDPRIGRFLSQDSYLGSSESPPSLHRYLYASSNPTSNIDPTGYATVSVGQGTGPMHAALPGAVSTEQAPALERSALTVPGQVARDAAYASARAAFFAMNGEADPQEGFNWKAVNAFAFQMAGDSYRRLYNQLDPVRATLNFAEDIGSRANEVSDELHSPFLPTIGIGIGVAIAEQVKQLLFPKSLGRTVSRQGAGATSGAGIGVPVEVASSQAAWAEVSGEIRGLEARAQRWTMYVDGAMMGAALAGSASRAVGRVLGRAADVARRMAVKMAAKARRAFGEVRRLTAEAASGARELATRAFGGGGRGLVMAERELGHIATAFERARIPMRRAERVVAEMETPRRSVLPTPGQNCVGGLCSGAQGCFAAGTPVATTAGGRRIETLRVGERVATLGAGSETQVDSSWVTVALRLDMRDAPGTQADITLLRPASWLLANGVHRAGDRLRLRLAEIGMEGVATVISIRGPPEVEPGPGRVVLGVISHVDHDVYIARFEGTALTLRVTGAHRFYSLAREAWLPIAEVQPGEALQTRDGALVLKSLQHLEGMERVYNIEVESEHEYLVSELAVRTHNTCPVAQGRGAHTAPDLTAELTRSGDSARARLRRELDLQRGNPAEAHHVIPLELREHELVQRAARGGFHFNGSENGVPLSFDRHRGTNIFHHNRYTRGIRTRLDFELRSAPNLSDREAAALLRRYTERVARRLIETNGRLR